MKKMYEGVYENYRKRAEELVKKLTLDEKCGLLSTHQEAVERLGLSELFVGTEVARGYVGRSPERISTVFPQPEGLAATFDKELLGKLGEIAGNEGRAYYNKDKNCDLALWGPTVDLARDPRWGRNEESYGEDPCLTGQMSAAYTKGMEGDDGNYVKTIPTLKHFCADNNEENRATCNAVMPLHLKYEYYYKAFEYPIRHGGAKSLMGAYNEINGVPGLLNPELRTMVKDDWGLWYVVSDGGDFTQNLTAHHYVDSHAESFALSIKAGADLMTDNDDCVAAAAKKALEDGLLTETELDKSIVDVLTARFALGQFDEDCKHNDIPTSIIDCDEYKEVNKKAAMEQVVLLKNEGILPLKEAPKKLAVVGAMADENLMDWYTGYSSGDHSVLDSAKELLKNTEVTYDTLWDRVAVVAPNGKYWSVKEDGTVVADADKIGENEIFEHQKWGENWNNFFSVKHQRYIRLMDDNTFRLHNRRVYEWFTRETIVETEVPGGFVFEEWLHRRRLFTDEAGKLSVKKTSTITPDTIFRIKILETGEARAARLAKDNDFVLYCVGNHPTQVAKECYDRKTLKLNIQENMAIELHENNPNTVMAVISSYPYSINEENEKLPAVMWSSHAGAYLGDAIIETIMGSNNPAGRLSQTWYRTEKDLPSIMQYDIEKGGTTYMYFKGQPLYPFGHGLSYSSFAYDNVKVTNDGKVAVTVDVTNVSSVAGDEVVQLYYAKKESEVSRPIKKLCGFARVNIAAGETKKVTIEADKDFLEIYNTRNNKFALESGEYEFMVGASSDDIRACASICLEGESLGFRADEFEAESFDDSVDITISYSKKNASHYISATGWNSEAIYDGVSFEGKTVAKIYYAAVGGKGKLTLTPEGCETVEINTLPTDGYDDIAIAEAKLPENMPENCSLSLGVKDGVVVYKVVLGDV